MRVLQHLRTGGWVRGPWGTTLASGGLIALAFAGRGLSSVVFDVGLLAATAVAGVPIATRAVRDLRIRRIGIELLVTIAVVGALLIGELWEGAAVTFLFAFGGALERATVGRTRQALGRLFELVPETAVVRREGTEVEVAPWEVLVGEVVIVRPGGKIPVDGVVVGGRAAVDEASITGESMPVEKSESAEVYASTVTSGGVLEIQATRVGQDTALSAIIHRVEEAQEDKASAQRFIERFARWYTPAIMALAVGAYLVTGNVELALTLLVNGGPGAVVISMPVAMVAGIGRSARDGVLVKGGDHLERIGAISAVAFDKTGTITLGRPRLEQIVPVAPDVTADQVLAWAAAAEAPSEHPLAAPILDAAAEAGVAVSGRTDGFTSHVGAGVELDQDGEHIAVGTARLAEALGVDVPTRITEQLESLRRGGLTAMLVLHDRRVVGILGLADEIRPDATEALDRLREIGIERIVMLTGDAPAVGDAVGTTVGVDEVRAGLTPEEKLEAIEQLQRDGHVVAMVGDGVNDAPALATADVGVALGGSATPVAVETADVAVMSGRLRRVADAIELSRRTNRVVRQNVAIALATVSALLAGVLVGEVMMAAGMLVHQLSVVVVVLNAVRLLRHRGARGEQHEPGERFGEVADRAPSRTLAASGTLTGAG